MKTVSYKTSLNRRLADRRYAAGYLSACLAQGRAEFLLGLRDVVDAHGGIGKLAEKSGLHRVSLYRLLSKKGNPSIDSVIEILAALGIELRFYPLKNRSKAA